MLNYKEISLPENTRIKENQVFKPLQSATSLFHFVDKLEYLLEILEKQALIPRYCREDVEYLDIEFKSLAYPMICFCDINFHKIKSHVEFYGKYGVGFSKDWGIKNKVQPIQYINKNSYLQSDFKEAFSASLKSKVDDLAHDFLLTQMLYYKPLHGTMTRQNQHIKKVFTDECEWRYIPNVSLYKLKSVLKENEEFLRNDYNNALKQAKGCWLKFNWNDIKYIIIESNDYFSEILNILDSQIKNKDIKNRIISKIIIWNEMEGDF